MPNMSGPEAVQRLRQCGYRGLLIGVTGDCYQDQMDRYVALGADAVLPKPLKVDVLRAKLEELWRR
jgi:CheY-like chemotaxis protein